MHLRMAIRPHDNCGAAPYNGRRHPDAGLWRALQDIPHCQHCQQQHAQSCSLHRTFDCIWIRLGSEVLLQAWPAAGLRAMQMTGTTCRELGLLARHQAQCRRSCSSHPLHCHIHAAMCLEPAAQMEHSNTYTMTLCSITMFATHAPGQVCLGYCVKCCKGPNVWQKLGHV